MAKRVILATALALAAFVLLNAAMSVVWCLGAFVEFVVAGLLVGLIVKPPAPVPAVA